MSDDVNSYDMVTPECNIYGLDYKKLDIIKKKLSFIYYKEATVYM